MVFSVSLLLVILLPLVIAVYFLYLKEYLRERKRRIDLIEKFGGPPAYPILGNIPQLSTVTHEFHAQFLQFAKEAIDQGKDIARFWIGARVYVAPLTGETLKPLVESNTELVKGVDYEFYRQFLGNGLLTSSGDYWRSRRKMLTPAFHFSILNDFMHIFNKETTILMEQLEMAGKKNIQPIDLFPYVKRFALDVICMTAMGTKVNAQREHNSEYVSAINKFGEYSLQFSLRYPIYQFRLFWYLFGSGFATDRALKTITGFTKKVIQMRAQERTINKNEHMANGNVDRKPALLDLLLNKQEENKMNLDDIWEEVETFMFAGHDTTAVGIGWCLWCLAHYPHIQEQVHQEIIDALGTRDGDVTMDDLTRLPLLERCIKEALRLFPSAPSVQRELQQDLVIGMCRLPRFIPDSGDHIVPKGTNMCICALLVHRNHKVYENPSVFDPDRFLPEAIAKRHQYSYVPFSAGPRNCIGQKFAMLEEKVALSRLLRRFRFDCEGEDDDLMSNKPCMEAVQKPFRGFPLRFVDRIS